MITSPDTMNAPKTTVRIPSEDRALNAARGNTFPDPVARLEPAAGDPDRPVVRPTVATRGAVIGHNVRYVLIFGLIGVVVAFAVLFLTYRT